MSTPQIDSRWDRLLDQYRRDHQNPVNKFLHTYVGWPICSLGVLTLVFRPWWGVGIFMVGYAIMWFGHFVFEGNMPTVFRHPLTPFLIGWKVVRSIFGGGRVLESHRTR